MNTQYWIDTAEENILHAYNRYGIVLEKGEGVCLYDTDGKEYLDFGSGIGVCGLGYGNAELCGAIKSQVDTLMHTSNLYYSPVMSRAAERLTRASGMSRVFFCNSGAEAMEGALKAAKKYASERDGFAGHEIIAMENSFHGRTIGALSVTGTKKYRDPFEPLMPGVSFAKFNNLESVEALVTEKTCAVVMETLQGEGGVFPAEPEFIRGVRKLCDEKDIVLILDEVQCGVGRTGEMFCWQGFGVMPDIMTCAKALGGGVPVGAFVLNEKLAKNSIKPGDHGSTFGGNPLAAAAVDKVLEIFERGELLPHIRKVGAYLEARLDALSEEFDFVLGRRGTRLMQGLVLDEKVKCGDVVNACRDAGLLVLTAGNNVVRILPPLVIEKDDVDKAAEIFRGVLREVGK